MIIYNVTCNVEAAISEKWQNWMKTTHIPEVMECGIFTSVKMHKVLSGNDGGDTFAIAYSCKSMKDFHQYQIKHAPDLQKKHTERYGTKVVSFRTLLEEIEKF
tara:strand:+ start:176 stop:484 length:309 start_codon:yes stop_codon:yes gene_type:complete